MLARRKEEPKYEILPLKESMKIILDKSQSLEGKYKHDQIKPHTDYILSKQVNNPEDFIQPLKSFGFKTQEIKNIIYEFKKFMEINKVDLILMNRRQFKKANKGEINILYNSVTLRYPKDFHSFFEDYIKRNYSEKHNSQDLISKFKSNIENLIQKSSDDKKILLFNDAVNDPQYSQIDNDDISFHQIDDDNDILFNYGTFML